MKIEKRCIWNEKAIIKEIEFRIKTKSRETFNLVRDDPLLSHKHLNLRCRECVGYDPSCDEYNDYYKMRFKNA